MKDSTKIVLRSRGAAKRFDQEDALKGVDLEVHAGECFGLLGPNGAGKSTFINLVYGALHRTGGQLEVLGFDPENQSREVKKRIGVVTQDNALDESLTVEENMLLYASFIGVSRERRSQKVHELLDFMNLAHKKGDDIRTLSGGMKRRLVFVRALIGDPEILILDEPTTGLDPAVRHLLWKKVTELREKRVTILLTTHYMHEAEFLCDRVAILNKGLVLQIATPRELIEKLVPGYVGIYPLQSEVQKSLEAAIAGKNGYHLSEQQAGIYLRTKELESLIALQERGVTALQMRPSNLEDVFLTLTGEELTASD